MNLATTALLPIAFSFSITNPLIDIRTARADVPVLNIDGGVKETVLVSKPE